MIIKIDNCDRCLEISGISFQCSKFFPAQNRFFSIQETSYL